MNMGIENVGSSYQCSLVRVILFCFSCFHDVFVVLQHSRHASGNSSQSAPSPTLRRQSEDKWHNALCANFVHEYKQYLQTLGFIPIQTEPTSPTKGYVARSSFCNFAFLADSHSDTRKINVGEKCRTYLRLQWNADSFENRSFHQL